MATDLSPQELAYLQERQAAAQQAAAPVKQAPAQSVARSVAGNVIPAEQTAPTSEAGVGAVQQPSAAPINYGPMISNVSSAYRDLKQQAPSVIESLDASMPWLKYAAGLVGAGIVGSRLLGQEKQSKPSGIQARSIVKTEPQMDVSVRQPDGRIEPTLDVVEKNIGQKPTIPSIEEAAAQAPVPPNISATDNVSKKDTQLVGNLETGKAVSKAKEAGANKPIAPPQRVDFQKILGAPTLTTGSGMPAYEGQGGESAKMKKEFKSIADVPKGYVFVPEGQLMDITRNAVGQEAFTAKLGEFGGYPLTQGQAYEQSRNINKSLGRPSYIEAKAAGVEPEPTKSITKSVGGSKLVKVAGVGGALISLANVANAKEAAQTVGEMLLPIGLTPSTLASGTLPPEILAAQERQMKERQKLGSPFRSVPPPK